MDVTNLEQTEGTATISPCCKTKIYRLFHEGVQVGLCGKCEKHVLWINPLTGVEEWLVGTNLRYDEELPPVGLS
jgi:hypothetical protein